MITSGKIEFNKSKDWFKNRLDSVGRYTTKQEKEILLLEDDKSYTEILKHLSDIEPLNEYEASALICKLRSNSVSDIIEMNVTCQNCDYMEYINVEIDEFFNMEPEPIKSGLPLGLFLEPDDIVDNSENLILKDYNNLKKDIEKRTQEIFKPAIKRECKRCLHKNEYNINVRQIISKSSPTNIFKEYLDLSYYTHNSKRDIDSMYPFEREIFIRLLNKKIEDPLKRSK